MVTITGQAAEVRWGYYTAATLGPWSLVDGQLTAIVVDADTYRVSQHPLVFEVTRATGAWTWPLTSVQIAGTTLTASLQQE